MNKENYIAFGIAGVILLTAISFINRCEREKAVIAATGYCYQSAIGREAEERCDRLFESLR